MSMDKKVKAIIGAEYRKKKVANHEYFEFIPGKELLIDFQRKEHALILAKSGTGKSYLAGVIAEEIQKLFSHDLHCGFLMIDPMGINHGLKSQGKDEDLFRWNSTMRYKLKTMQCNVEIWVPAGDADKFGSNMLDKQFSLRANQLTPDIFAHVFDLSFVSPQVSLYRKARKKIMKENENYSLKEFEDFLYFHFEAWHYRSATAEALICKLDILEELDIISQDGIQLANMIKAGVITVLDTSMSDDYTAKLIVNFMAQSILSLRKRMQRFVDHAQIQSKLICRPDDYIPPIKMLVDEAHKFLPQNLILKKFIKEGRNYGCNLYAISQSPDLDRNTYANIIHIYIGQMTWSDDIDRVHKMIPVVRKKSEFRRLIKSLDIGNFVYYNMDSKIEKLIRIRPRLTFHSADTEIHDERKFFIEHYEKEADLLDLISENGISPKEIPKAKKAEFNQLVKEGKVVIDSSKGTTIIKKSC